MKKKITHISSVIYCMAVCFMVALIIYLGITENVSIFSARKGTDIQKVEVNDFSETEDSDTPIGIKKEYRWTLGNVDNGDICLAFYSVHHYLEVYCGEELVYSLMPSDDNKIGKTVGSNWVMIPLYPEDSGKEIRVVATPVYESFRNRQIDFMLGSPLDIYLQRLKSDLPQLILGLLAVLVGVVFILMAVYNIIKKNRGGNLAALGGFSVMLGLWRLTDTRFSPLVFTQRPVFVYYISLAMMMIGIVAFIKSMQKKLNKLSNLMLDICSIILSVVCIIQIVLQITGIADFRETLFVTHIMIIISAFIIIGNTIYDRIINKNDTEKQLGRKMAFICVAGVVADVAAFYIKGNSSGLIFTLSAFLLYIICMGIYMLLDYKRQELKLKEQEAELANSRISIMLSQIQPHFLYNSLNTIHYLCEKDPKAAKTAICDFSDYLRGNLDSIKRTAPVPFDMELKHIKIYLSLEKMRFEEELDVIYDIETTEFSLPSLTVQPLIENAVKHGVGSLPLGGTVKFSTREYKDHFEISVQDNGVGFDVNEQKNDGKTHIGIENVRNRLWKMSNATLDITSVKGQGTTAVIKIPK